MSSSISNMGDRAVYLVGIDPPSNLLARLVKINRNLFGAFGIVSGLALDPFIPVCALAGPPDRPELRELSRLPPLSTRRWKIVEETLFLELEPEDRLRTIVEEMPARLHWAPLKPPPLSMYPGIYLTRLDDPPPPASWPEERVDLRRPDESRGESVLAAVGEPPMLRWTGAGLCCRRLSFSEQDGWWGGISSEAIWAVRLRGERKED